VAVVGGLGQALAAVVDTDEVLVRLLGRPTGAHGERRVELAFDFTDVETDAECGPGERRGKTDGQRQFARRQNWFTDVIDATPCALLLWQ
jgi:hypothetical protein